MSDTAYVTEEYIEPSTKDPNVPIGLQERYPERAWRWLSKPQCARQGLRGWTVYSPDEKERAQITRGERCDAGIHVNVENQIAWHVDGFLAWKPKRQHEYQKAQIRARTDQQTQRAKTGGDFARLTGGKVKASVEVGPDLSVR